MQSSFDIETFKLIPLPWSPDSLSPFLSENAIQLHYDLHHRGYVEKMNYFAQQYPELKSLNLAHIVENYTGKIQDTASQILNHDFFWKCLSPKKLEPSGRTYQFISQQFKSFDNFILEFNQKAINHFGSGWIWLVYDTNTNFLLIVEGHDAYNPIMDGYIPLLVIDIWEHAYYPDYLNDKKSYVERFWDFVNWNYVKAIIEEQITGNSFKTLV